MSKMVPLALVNVLRNMTDMSMDIYGIECSLYIPSNVDSVETNDVYQVPSEYTFAHYTTKVWIDWSPNAYMLRKKGFFTEHEIPMTARFGSVAYNEAGQQVAVIVIPNSYIRVPVQFVPKQIDTSEFEVVNVIPEAMHDAVALQVWKLVPRRVKLT